MLLAASGIFNTPSPSGRNLVNLNNFSPLAKLIYKIPLISLAVG